VHLEIGCWVLSVGYCSVALRLPFASLERLFVVTILELPQMSEAHIGLAQESLGRLNAAPKFCATFYQLLLESSPVIPPMFAATEFEKQCKQLRHGLGLLLAYAKHKNPILLERVAVRHSRRDVNVAPDLYALFLESLLKAIAIHDPQFSPELDQAWRAAVTPGVDFMKSMYGH
jgi:hemoglobin-like flavoprotein